MRAPLREELLACLLECAARPRVMAHVVREVDVAVEALRLAFMHSLESTPDGACLMTPETAAAAAARRARRARRPPAEAQAEEAATVGEAEAEAEKEAEAEVEAEVEVEARARAREGDPFARLRHFSWAEYTHELEAEAKLARFVEEEQLAMVGDGGEGAAGGEAEAEAGVEEGAESLRARVAEAVRGAVLQALLADTTPLCVAVCGLLCRSAAPQQAERRLAVLLAAWGERAQQALVKAVSQHAGEGAAAAAVIVAAEALARTEVALGRELLRRARIARWREGAAAQRRVRGATALSASYAGHLAAARLPHTKP
jgi:hypothetical protein